MRISDEQKMTDSPPARWWLRRPAAGVAASLAIGAVGIWVTAALAPPDARSLDAVGYLVSLPIALLLPAAALAGALIGWQAWRASGAASAALALPALAAVAANVLAIGIFVRVIARLVLG